MSDMMSGGRAANGGGARAQGPVPVPQPQSATVSRAAVIPPTEIMRRRGEREAKARLEASSSQQGMQGQWEGGYETDPTGVASPPPPAQPQPAVPQQSATSSAHRRTYSAAAPTTRTSGGQPSSSAATYPQVPSSQAPRYSPSAPAVQPPANIPQSSQQPPAGSATVSRPRASSARQPRPVQASPAAAGASSNPRPPQPSQGGQRQSSGSTPLPRPPQDPPEVRADRQRLAQEAGMSAGTTAENAGRRGDGTVSTFPHAFERWEMLSSKWEGMTSHWISRLQMNSEELQNQPMLAQLSRQVTDLSAAGANLFTALVELQRLRASSERKFQRWFHDTRNEMERQQELVGQLERALIQERRDRADDQVNSERLIESARRTEINFSRLDTEKNRELQIAKDESRRAWEELGRYEALERERQKALAQGLPVEIGGYTVYPRLFPESRQGSVTQSTAGGAARPTSRRGPQTTQPIEDDPFIADTGAGDALLHEQSEAGTWSPSRTPAASTYASHPAYTTAADYATTSGGGYTSFTAPPPAAGVSQPGFYSQTNTHLGGNPSDEDFEYERDAHGNILVDEHGRPLSYRRGLHEARSSESEGESQAPYTSFGAHDPADTRRQRYPAGTSAAQQPSMQTRPEVGYGFFEEGEEEEDDDVEGRYEGRGYGEPVLQHSGDEGVNYHPTRLSDVPEEDELSRASEAGGGRGAGVVNVTGAPF